MYGKSKTFRLLALLKQRIMFLFQQSYFQYVLVTELLSERIN